MSIAIDNSKLNEQQLDMLKLLKKPLPEASFAQIRRLAVKLIAEQLEGVMDKWERDNDITEETYINLSKEHFRSKDAK